MKWLCNRLQKKQTKQNTFKVTRKLNNADIVTTNEIQIDFFHKYQGHDILKAPVCHSYENINYAFPTLNIKFAIYNNKLTFNHEFETISAHNLILPTFLHFI